MSHMKWMINVIGGSCLIAALILLGFAFLRMQVQEKVSEAYRREALNGLWVAAASSIPVQEQFGVRFYAGQDTACLKVNHFASRSGTNGVVTSWND